MGKLHVQHGGQRGAEHGDELGRVSAVVRVHQVHGRQLKEARKNTYIGSILYVHIAYTVKCSGDVIIIIIIIHFQDCFKKLTLKFHLTSCANIFFTELWWV